MSYLSDEERLKKNHIIMMRHPETALYGSVMLMGNSEVVEGIPTAYTDGENKRYGKEFMATLSDAEARAVVLHENLHVALLHIHRHKDLMKEDHVLANVSMDIVVNNIIDNIKGQHQSQPLCKLPESAIIDHKFDGWAVREIYNELQKQNPQRKQKGSGGGGSCESDDGDETNGSGQGEVININGKQVTVADGDEHDMTGANGKDVKELKEFEEKVGRALREGGMLAGRLGANIPREISQSLEIPINWKDEFRDFVSNSVRGKDEMTWRRFNRNLLANDIYAPSEDTETLTEVCVGIDTSGSIGTEELGAFAYQLQMICDVCKPDTVRILWWDTEVHGEQVFAGDSPNIKDILKPMGGGGTTVSCVSDYLKDKKYTPDCLVIFTDGYVEDRPRWETGIDTLWLVTQNRNFKPPKGKLVKFNK
jgi:predicted metal-dependent peptidase